eukprot:CAMPEP_0170215286 /NCGR_PEP_ID=MMETSP0116_2-20130129/7278_1 /TAXON_ID=400756 /ORGANISM="Durinskia baltica, Strain CSIRO CS-38" /LENGTH=214 /DNA_ID=CAMNT_0010465859 /DNA_START=124 /DNA_END=766 /DNA_ORIENTATION=+
MATDLCTRRLTKELRALQKDPIKSPKITVQPNEANILEMHYVIEGSEKTPYEGGIYWGKLIFPKTYPLKPPSVMMMPPPDDFSPIEGFVFQCRISIQRPGIRLWSVSTILTGLYSFMIETAPTLGSIDTTTSQKQKFARQSLEFNVRDPTFCKLFPEYAELYRKRLDERQAALGLSGTEPLSTGLPSMDHNALPNADGGDVQGIFAAAAGVIAL